MTNITTFLPQSAQQKEGVPVELTASSMPGNR
jgi:hypothetical protein